MDAALNPRSNLLLRALSAEDLARLEVDLTVLRVPARTVLYARDEPIRFVFFPLNGVASVVATDGNGSAIEIVAVGREGMLGVPALLGAGQAPSDVVMEIGGAVGRVRVEPMLAWIAGSEAAERISDRYVAARLAQTGQSAACHRLHHLDTRVARWLLDMHDRVGDEEFMLTQESLAAMLGVTRPKVSIAANRMRAEGAIGYLHGCLRILDRPLLERLSCECYFTIRAEFERLLPGREMPAATLSDRPSSA
jgi:CRP-like cAMP-binding protein